MTTATAADMGAHFGEYLKASEKGPVVITRNGKPAAVLLAVTDEDEVERLLMAHSPQLNAILGAARKRIEEGKGLPEKEFWAAVKENTRKTEKRKKRVRAS